MKSPLKKLCGFGFHKNDAKEKRVHPEKPKLDELVQADQDMQEMRNCYDSLLSAAATTINSAYEFSEALKEMGSCLHEKVALNDDEESSKVLLMLGKVQFTLHKLVDNYRANIIRTITTPSESLLKELQTVEEMKRQCDYKRELYKAMLAAQAEKGNAKHTKRGTFSSKQLQAAHEDYEQEAMLFIFRLRSLKQGQPRSLLTQAARHFAVQLNFFRKGLISLESAEPFVKRVALGQHIDYGLEEELSFDYDQINHTAADISVISMPKKSMELDQAEQSVPPASVMALKQDPMHKKQANLLASTIRLQPSSKSAPILSNMSTDLSKLEVHEIRPSPARKFHSYALPMPVDSKSPSSNLSGNTISTTSKSETDGSLYVRLRHPSPPLELSKFAKDFKDDKHTSPIMMHPALSCEFPARISDPRKPYAAKNIKRNAYSSPLLSRRRSTIHAFSGLDTRWSNEFPAMPDRITPPRRLSVSPERPSNMLSAPPTVPRISELHELPLPPVDHARSAGPSSLIGYSAPLLSRGQEVPPSNIPPLSFSHAASLLPTPTMARSLSISSEGQRAAVAAPIIAKLHHGLSLGNEVFSPPLSPMSIPMQYQYQQAPKELLNLRSINF